MKYGFKTMTGVLALGLVLLFGAVSFAHTTKGSMTNSAMSALPMANMGNERQELRRHRHRRHHHRHIHR